jgi:ADP-heptose:LPS heptosyltransferase/predicted SAM-dependent methyltransferase
VIWRISDPEGDEASKVKFEIAQYTRGLGLDIGCGPHKAFPHFIGVDSKKDTALFGIEMEPDNVVEDAASLPQVPTGKLDFVFSSHLLEHIEDYQGALREWWRIIKVGGHMVLYLPHRDLYPRIGQPGANPDHKHDFKPQDIIDTMTEITREVGNACDVLVCETRAQRMEYSFLLVLRKIERDENDASVHSYLAPRPTKTACISRFGGFGDMLMASALLPELKRQGYHITLNTTPSGQDILLHDPHIDDWLIVDPDQVPNHQLPLFWEAIARRYTKFIQLSESIEGTLLAMPGRANHAWPHAVRHMELNRNYLEWCAELAELPYRSDAKFYPSLYEQGIAAGYLTGIRLSRAPKDLMIGVPTPDCFIIVWALAGSSMHKFYPHMDAVIAKLLLELPEAVVILTGDMACQILEAGWEIEPRVYRASGKQSIRETLTLATMADCVVGPETGVLNAVAFEAKVAKVALLSHSSVENLTKHWLNTESLAAPFNPANPVCNDQACHRLHYGKIYCVEDEATGASSCQSHIAPSRVFDAIKAAYAAWKDAN